MIDNPVLLSCEMSSGKLNSDKLVKKVFIPFKKLSSIQKEVIVLPTSSAINRGRVLFSYIPYSLRWKDNNPKFDGHSNKWASKEISRIFNQMGYIVDAINWSNQNFQPKLIYDIVFDIYTNLQRINELVGNHVIKLLHLTGSYPSYQNQAELKRIENFKNRTGIDYQPRRQVIHPDLLEKSLEIADYCALIGNQHTLSTFPKKYHHKMSLVTVIGSNLYHIKNENEYSPEEKEFLWFFGGGAVHKGLDLLLEVFARHPEYTLNIVGDISTEEEFQRAYQKELNLKNIRYHGRVDPNSREFATIAKKTFCFIAPSCSESISTAAVTCLQLGLYPIVSRDTGITLPDGIGKYLITCSIDEIEQSINEVWRIDKKEICRQIKISQDFAINNYSHSRFTSEMTEFINKAISKKSSGTKLKSVEFEWNNSEFNDLLKSCEKDEAVQLTIKYLTNKNNSILEAGCGSGRVVKYLSDLGYNNVYGLEINKRAVEFINRRYPELKISQGDILEMPYKKNFDAILAYGVVEHFPEGLDLPLKAIYNKLTVGGLALITVPSFNYLRRLRHLLSLINIKKLLFPKKRNKGLYHINPPYGNFFEYVLSKKEFETACRKVGFKIVKSQPIYHIDGLYHLFNPILGDKFIAFKNWRFIVSQRANILNMLLKKIPFFHNHMHACILKK